MTFTNFINDKTRNEWIIFLSTFYTSMKIINHIRANK